MRLSLNDIFRYDIPEIDTVHDQIVLMLNEIGDCLTNGDFDSAMRQIIHLIAVERKHARFENQLLEKHNYGETASHKDYHAELSAVLNNIMSALAVGDQERSIGLYEQLCKVFLDDLLTADLPFKSLLQHRMLGR